MPNKLPTNNPNNPTKTTPSTKNTNNTKPATDTAEATITQNTPSAQKRGKGKRGPDKKPRKKVENAAIVRKSPLVPANMFNLEPGDNSRFVQFGMVLSSFSKVDLYNPEAVNDRINEFFQTCFEYDMKPAVAGLGLALDLDRRRLWELNSGVKRTAYPHLPEETVGLIKKAYQNMELLWENYMQNGKVNPVSGIFLGKNNFGYKDQSETVISVNNPLGEEPNTEEIAQRYALNVGQDGTDEK